MTLKKKIDKITIEGRANDCLALASKLTGFSHSEKISDNKYIFTYIDNKSALKALIYLWNQIKNISDETDGLSTNKRILFFGLSFAYYDKEN